MSIQNIAVKLCGLLQSQSEEEVTAREWRLVGQEQDGSQLLTWISTKDGKDIMNIGVYTNKTKILSTLYTFEEKLNIIQASVNSTHSLLAYVVKVLPSEESEVKEALYCPYLICLLPDKVSEPEIVEEGSTKQIMLQYVYGKSNKYSPGIRNDRFLLFKHLEYIKIYRTPMFLNECDDGTEKWGFDGIYTETEKIVHIHIKIYRTPMFLNECDDGTEKWGFDGIYTETEKIVHIFSWAQWDCANQVLFYIHHRAPLQSFAEGEEVRSPAEPAPTLSALQFHADLPHETVLNIPLSLPHAGGGTGSAGACGSYEDDPVPLRVHDCGIDLYILCDQRGVLCVCHHYLYKALDDSTSSLALDDVDKDSGVNFAYSVTLLNHGCVVHSVLPDLPWSLAKSLRPSYTLYEENHLLVSIPMLFTHLIDISPHHEPCCHIVIPQPGDSGPSLAPLLGWGAHAMVDLNTLDVVTMTVQEKDLSATFKSDTVIENKLGIIHYLIQHAGNTELAEELVSWMCVNQPPAGGLQRAMQEYLVCGAYAVTRRSLPPSALPLAAHLPYTVHLAIGDVKAGRCVVHVSLAALWRVAAAVVLSPRQRVCQFAEDAWTRLWAALQRPAPNRLRPSAVAARLAPALACYQPEALSRASTPLSPTTRRPSFAAHDGLPFVEIDVCTTSRQEHVIAANMRAVSVHVLSAEGVRLAGVGEAGVHALATRRAGAQLDAEALFDELEPAHALILFKLFEAYYLAAEAVAFPLPQGFPSFLTYLGYRALPFHMFMQYVHRNVLELQIDVMKAIIATKDDSTRTVEHKLRLIQLVGEARGRRALSAWPHRAALVLRARDHAHALLSGRPAPPPHRAPHRPHRDTGIAALPSGERLSPLDTFLDLLTAKASLNELDFNLIIEATLASVQDSTA